MDPRVRRGWAFDDSAVDPMDRWHVTLEIKHGDLHGCGGGCAVVRSFVCLFGWMVGWLVGWLVVDVDVVVFSQQTRLMIFDVFRVDLMTCWVKLMTC